MHTLSPQRLQEMLASPEAAALSADAQERLTWIAHYVTKGESVSATCEHFGIARSTFHRWLNRFDPTNVSSLEEKTDASQRLSVPAHVIELIRAYRTQSPLMGKELIRELLLKEHNEDVSSSTVGRVIERECLYFGDTPLHLRKRSRREQTASSAETVTIAEPMQAMPAANDTSRKSETGRLLRRFAIIVSVLTNLGFVAMLGATLLWEGSDRHVRASITEDPNHIRSALDPSFTQ